MKQDTPSVFPWNSATYTTSVAKPGPLPLGHRVEIAFAGRSNAGKSTTLNSLCRQKSLARVSKTPGRTQMINYFLLSNGCMLVDLPGYGFAKAPRAQRDAWGALVEHYLTHSTTLAGLVIVMDCRHPLKDTDLQMIRWSEHQQLPVLLLLNKSDKLKRGAAAAAKQSVQNYCLKNQIDAQVLLFSGLKKTGMDELKAALKNWAESD